jgi:hypothetical protein
MFTMQDAINEQWTMQPKFWEGYEDGQGLRKCKEYENVDGQAYDRGYEVGLAKTGLNAREVAELKERFPGGVFKPRYEHWEMTQT